MVGEMNIEAGEIGGVEKLAHEVSGARPLGANPDGSAPQAGDAADRATSLFQEQQRLRLRKPPEQFETGGRRHGRAVLNERELFHAATAVRDEAVDVLDRTRGRDDFKTTAIRLDAFLETRSKLVIGASRSSRQKRGSKRAKITDRAEGQSDRGDYRGSGQND